VLLNTPIGMAAANGQLDIVRLLMKDRRVDAHDYAEYALRQAILNGHQRVAAALVMDSTILWAIGFAQSQPEPDRRMIDFLIDLENTRKHVLAVDTDLTGDHQLLTKGVRTKGGLKTPTTSNKKHKAKKKKMKMKKTATASGSSGEGGERKKAQDKSSKRNGKAKVAG
jgi:hypothetical protein